MEYLNDSLFHNLPIKYIFLPKGIKQINYYNPFDMSTSLENIDVDLNNQYFTSVDGILFSKNMDTLIQYPIGKKQSKYVIPSSVKFIGFGAFSRQINLNQIIISDVTETIYGEFCYECADAIKEIIVFRRFGQKKLDLGTNPFKYTTFQESDITYIYSKFVPKTCELNYHIFSISMTLLPFILI